MSLRTRVLAAPPDWAIPRHVVDWLVQHQDKARILVPQSLLENPKQLARMRHLPFEPTPAVTTEAARSIGEALVTPGTGSPVAAVPGTGSAIPALPGAGSAAPPVWAIEATAIALLERAAVLLPHADLFPGVIPLSAWSMNVPAPPADDVLARHAQVAAGLADVFRGDAAAALEALISGEPARLERMRRERRRHARTDGPGRFAAFAPRSEGRRPAVVYLDLLRVPEVAAGAGASIRDLLAAIDRPTATRLCAMSGALFLF